MGPGFLRVGGGGGIAGNVYINGNVGIGTSNPTTRLDVSGSINASGRIGIGIDAPLAPLDVSGVIRARSEIQFGSDGAFQIQRNTGASKTLFIKHFSNPSASVCFINDFPGGTTNVGIGTTNPTAALHVNGDTICNSHLYVNGVVEQTSGGGLFAYQLLVRSTVSSYPYSGYISWHAANGTRIAYMGNTPLSGNVATGDMQLYFQGGTKGLEITGDTDIKLTVRGPIGFSYTTLPTFTSSQIGYTFQAGVNATPANTAASATNYDVLSYASFPMGTWILDVVLTYSNSTGATTVANTSINLFVGGSSSTNGYINDTSSKSISFGNANTYPTYKITSVIRTNGSQTLLVRANSNWSGNQLRYTYDVYATRIA
jgi:hypothetical protein